MYLILGTNHGCLCADLIEAFGIDVGADGVRNVAVFAGIVR